LAEEEAGQSGLGIANEETVFKTHSFPQFFFTSKGTRQDFLGTVDCAVADVIRRVPASAGRALQKDGHTVGALVERVAVVGVGQVTGIAAVISGRALRQRRLVGGDDGHKRQTHQQSLGNHSGCARKPREPLFVFVSVLAFNFQRQLQIGNRLT